jgi:hypothetical protein
MTVHLKKLTPNPNRIGKNVNDRKRSKFGPRKKSAQSHSRRIRRFVAGLVIGWLGARAD